jgi:hypothetical protein
MADASKVKPWYASQTVWGAIAAIVTGLGGAVYGYQQKDPTIIVTSLAGAAGGFHALVGRFKADTPIGRALATADQVIEAGAAIERATAPAPQPDPGAAPQA